MANSDKDILITTNTNQTSEPNVEFTGADNNTLSLNVLDSGALSFEASSGQLFSITDSLTGSIFSVNDISGIPSIEVNSSGTVSIAEYSGNVGIGTNNPTSKLYVDGTATFTGTVTGPTTVTLEILNSSGTVVKSIRGV